MLKTVSVDGGDTQFISLDAGWDGTVQRGVALPATWVEMHLVGTASGDVSLQQGCDGAATLSSTTSSDTQGFTENINDNANIPAGALFNPATQSTPCYNDDGADLSVQCTTSATNVLDTTTGNFWGPANTASTDYIESQLGGSTEAMEKAFVGTSDWNTTPQVTSSNNCFAVAFY